MTQTKSFSVFSNLKSEDHLKIKGKRKQQKTALHSLLRTVVGGIIESIAATTTAHFASYSKQTAKAEISTAFSNTRILLRLHR